MTNQRLRSSKAQPDPRMLASEVRMSEGSDDLEKAYRQGFDDGLAASRLPTSLRGDGPCRDCGTLGNIVWFTDNVFWNAVTGENVVHEESRGAILCVPCFVTRAAFAGWAPTKWRLLPEWPWRERSSGISPLL